MTKRRRGLSRRRWVAEVCDPGNPVAGLMADGMFPRSARYALARAIWDSILDGSAGLDARNIRGVEVISATSTCFALPPRQAGNAA